MFSFGGRKSNPVRDNHIKMLERWSSATPTRSDKSQWSVKFGTRKSTFVFLIILPRDFPEVAPEFKFQTPVDHPWVASHDGVTILNEHLLQWNPHCDITRIGKACVHEFVLNPPRLQSRRPDGGSGGRVAATYRKKPFGLKLRPRNKVQQQGAVIDSFERFHVPQGLQGGMWLVTIGPRSVENMKFSSIITLLGEVSLPVQLQFQAPVKRKAAAQPLPSYNYGDVYQQPARHQQPARPSPAVYNQPRRPAPVSRPAAAVAAQPQQPPKPKYPVKKDFSPPEIPNSTYDILDKYNINQLKDLITDDLALEQVAMDAANKDLNRMRKKLREDTKTAANKNLSYKDPIDASRTELDKLRKEVDELQSANRTLLAEKQRLAPTFDKFQIKKAFANAAERIDDESQEILDKFESDDIAYVTFIKKYKASRESHHQHLITKGLIG